MSQKIKQEKDLKKLLQSMKPTLHNGDYVFCTVSDLKQVEVGNAVFFFKEDEGFTIVLEKEIADRQCLHYSFIAGWITLSVYSSLEAVGLTATFSKALAKQNISCNVVSAYYHDHIFVDRKDAEKAMTILNKVSSG